MTTFTTDDRIHAEKDGSLTLNCLPKALSPKEIEKLAENCWYSDEDLMIFNYQKFAVLLQEAHGIK